MQNSTPPLKFESNFEGYSVKFSPYTQGLLACSFNQYFGMIGNGKISIIQNLGNSLKESQVLNCNSTVFDLAWSESNENHLVSGNGDGTVFLWDLVSSKPLIALKPHTAEVFSLSWSHIDTSKIVTGSNDGTSSLIDLNKGVVVQTYSEHTGIVYNAKWHVSLPNVFATSSSDHTIRLWDINVGKAIKVISGHTTDVMALDFNKYENTIVSGGADGSVKVFDLKAAEDLPVIAFQGHGMPTRAIACSPYLGNIVVSVGYDMNVCVWDLANKAVNNVFKHHTEFVIGVDFSIFDRRQLATISWDRSCWVYNWDEPFEV